MSYGSLYSGTATRRITLTNGSATVACAGTVLTEEDIRALDTLSVAGQVVKLAGVTDDVTLTLTRPWTGATAANVQAWDIIREAPSRLDPVEAAAAMTQAYNFASLINGQSRVFRIEGESNGPPAAPIEGKYYLVGTAPAGWPIAVTAGDIVKRRLGSYGVITPEQGWLVVNFATREIKIFKAGTWARAQVAATDIAVTPTGDIAATTAQAALAELDTKKVGKAGAQTAQGPLYISKPAGNDRILGFQTNNSNRFAIVAGNAPETGGNAGSDFLILSYNDNGTFMEAPFIIRRNSGLIEMSKNPMFLAYNPAAVNYSVPSGSPVPFNSLYQQIGSGFNISNYRFTAPVTGKYIFSFNIFNVQNTPSSRFYLARNGANFPGGFSQIPVTSGPETPVSSSHVVHMGTGDYVDVRSSSSTNTIYLAHCSFSGAFLG